MAKRGEVNQKEGLTNLKTSFCGVNNVALEPSVMEGVINKWLMMMMEIIPEIRDAVQL